MNLRTKPDNEDHIVTVVFDSKHYMFQAAGIYTSTLVGELSSKQTIKHMFARWSPVTSFIKVVVLKQ